METKHKRILVYDLETGGLEKSVNPITEFAGVIIDTSNLTIVKELSVMFKPRMDLSFINEDSSKEAKMIFKKISYVDPDSSLTIVKYGNDIILSQDKKKLIEPIDELKKFIEKRKQKYVFTYEEFLETKETKPELANILDIYMNVCYNPQAAELTHISRKMLLENGVEYEDGFNQIKQLFLEATIEGSKPVIAGHNIRKFDNGCMELLFESNKFKFNSFIDDFQIDTMDWARLKWIELPNFTLGACSSELNIVLKGAHRAINDTVANAELVIKFIENLRGLGNQVSKKVRKKFTLNI